MAGQAVKSVDPPVLGVDRTQTVCASFALGTANTIVGNGQFGVPANATTRYYLPFVADRTWVIESVWYFLDTIGTTGACTVQLFRQPNGTAVGSSTDDITGTISIGASGTATQDALTNWALSVDGSSVPDNNILEPGNRILAEFVAAASFAALAGLFIEVRMRPMDSITK